MFIIAKQNRGKENELYFQQKQLNKIFIISLHVKEEI